MKQEAMEKDDRRRGYVVVEGFLERESLVVNTKRQKNLCLHIQSSYSSGPLPFAPSRAPTLCFHSHLLPLPPLVRDLQTEASNQDGCGTGTPLLPSHCFCEGSSKVVVDIRL
jgi:hypothetical protein